MSYILFMCYLVAIYLFKDLNEYTIGAVSKFIHDSGTDYVDATWEALPDEES